MSSFEERLTPAQIKAVSYYLFTAWQQATK